MIWEFFTYFGLSSLFLWTISAVVVYIPFIKKSRNKISIILASLGVLSLSVFICILWIQLERPPLRTLGETRLWYSVFLPIIGVFSYIKWKYKWFFSYSLGLSVLFLIINILHPENFSKTLMPALQSPWFVPHVVVYIFAYALLAASSLIGLKGLFQLYKKKIEVQSLKLADNLVYLGFSFLTAGLIFGALWAKEAWGHYWTWDPKETWAFLTWIIYLIYIHISYNNKQKPKTQLIILSLAFVVLLVCWLGINYLPSAQNSVHIYSN